MLYALIGGVWICMHVHFLEPISVFNCFYYTLSDPFLSFYVYVFEILLNVVSHVDSLLAV